MPRLFGRENSCESAAASTLPLAMACDSISSSVLGAAGFPARDGFPLRTGFYGASTMLASLRA